MKILIYKNLECVFLGDEACRNLQPVLHNQGNAWYPANLQLNLPGALMPFRVPQKARKVWRFPQDAGGVNADACG